MATLAIGIAVNVAVSLALNALFPPPDIIQEGPRLTDLEVSSSSYGRPVNIPFGTVRIAGNIVWGNSIEEVRNEQTAGGKGLGGPSTTTIAYTYFATFDISLAVSGADDVLRVWADGKLVFDKTGSGSLGRETFQFTFYPGGSAQQRDPLEEAALGVAETPAYRHLSRMVFNRLPLADYGNRIPNITAEITFNAVASVPFVGMNEVGGTILPVAGNFIYIDDEINSYLTTSSNTNGQLRVDLNTGNVQTIVGSPLNGLLEPGYGHGIYLGATGIGSNTAVNRVNAISGVLEETSGFTVTNGVDGFFEVMKVGNPVLGETLIGIKAGRSIIADTVSLFNAQTFLLIDTFTPTGGTPITDEFEVVIPDDERGSNSGNMYIVSANGAATRVGKFAFTVTPGLTPADPADPSVDVGFELTTVGDFTFPAGAGRPFGWAVDASTGRLLISNAVSTVLYDPETASVIASTTAFAFSGRHNYVRSGVFGTAQGGASSGEMVMVNVSDLTVIKRIPIGDLGLSGNESVADTTSVWDDRAQAIVFSRKGGSSCASGECVLRVFVNRATGNGVALSSIVTSLCTTYQDIVMADLAAADFDVTPLVPFTVQGYNINRQSSIRDALQPLRKAYFFDAVQSDWGIKFPIRGAAPVLTIPEEQVGQAQFQEEGNAEFVQETRTQEVELPMRLNVRYKNRETNYDTDVEHAKRILKPTSAMFSKNEKTLDIPVVFLNGTLPKQISEKWLWTLWNERVQFKTVVPWTYLKLDPTDVFNMGLFGETHRLRMSEQDVGVSRAMEILGVREASFTFASTIAGSGAAGFINQVIEADAATKLILLDAPLLALADFNAGASTAAYVLMGAYTPTWPGGVTHISSDGIVFSPVVTSSGEMAWGTVTAAPGQWGSADDCGDFPNRFQEIAEGGQMTINVQQRDEAFVSATELDVMNRANAIGVVTANGVEILQFQDVVIPVAAQPNILRLDRLLRGRLGTEDISILGGPAIGDEVVLLRGELTSSENAVIGRQNLSFASIGLSRTYKAVTIGSALEDAFSKIFTYTGRDLKPYRPAHVTAADSAGDKVIGWTRRTRLNGDWLDGTGDVPLNESQEKYEVVIDDGSSSVTHVVDDVVTTTFTAAEIAGLTPPLSVSVRQVSGTTLKSPAADCPVP